MCSGKGLMISLEPVRKRFGDYICRRCLNEKYNVNLESRDCKYGYYAVCPVCHQERHIVAALNTSGKMKMLLK